MEEGKLTYASSFLFPKSSLKVILESLPDEQEINVKSSFSAFSPYHVRNIAIVIVFFCCSSEIFSFIIDTKHKMFSFVYIYLVELQDNKVGRHCLAASCHIGDRDRDRFSPVTVT